VYKVRYKLLRGADNLKKTSPTKERKTHKNTKNTSKFLKKEVKNKSEGKLRLSAPREIVNFDLIAKF